MIEKVTDKNFDELLPLIKEYQGFYGVEGIDENKNKLYFHQFVASNTKGVLHILCVEGKAIGFSTLYKFFSSTRAEEVAVLNDLFVMPSYRGNGYGKKLISHAIETAKSLGYGRLQWLTAKDNEAAQKLYDGLGATKSSWFFYAKETS